MITPLQLRTRRKVRQRFKISRIICSKYRLVIHRTNRHIYAQILDSNGSNTLVSVSSLSSTIKDKNLGFGNKESAFWVGKLLAIEASKKHISDVVFDRSGFLYHGRVKALADGAREEGLRF